MVFRFSLALSLALFACGPATHHGGDGGGDDIDAPPGPHELSSIEVTPTNPIVQLDLNQPGSQHFTATGHYLDGQTEDLTSQVSWVLANPAVGTLSGADLAIPAFSTATAITSKLSATYNGFEGPAQITVVAYRQSGAQQDFFFVLPYQDPSGPMNQPLNFSTNVPALDVFFLMDVTGSMGPEISNLQSALTSTVIPAVQNAVTDSQFGVGAYMDFPVNPFDGGTSDQPFLLRQTVTNNIGLVQSAINGLASFGSPIGSGGDVAESGIEAMYQAATGEGLSGPSPTNVPPNHTGVGGVAFRPGTLPVIVNITDALSHGVGETATCSTFGGQTGYDANVGAFAHSRAQAKTAISNICGRVVGISAQRSSTSLDCLGNEYLTDFARSTGTRVPPTAWDVGTRPAGCASTQCCTGQNGAGQAPDADGFCPLMFFVGADGSGVSSSVATGISLLTRFATFDVTSAATGGTTDDAGNPLPTPHTTADFLKMITPATFVLPPPPPVVPTPTFDATTFHNVTPGTQVGFTVTALNDFVMQTGDAQIFRAKIQVLAGGCTPLDERDVLILVPPIPIVIERTQVARTASAR